MAMNDLTKGIHIQTEDITPGDTYMQEIGMMTSQQNWSTFRALGREGISRAENYRGRWKLKTGH